MNKLNLSTEELKELFKLSIEQTQIENKRFSKAFRYQQFATKINSLEITTRTLYQLGQISNDCRTELFDYLDGIDDNIGELSFKSLLS